MSWLKSLSRAWESVQDFFSEDSPTSSISTCPKKNVVGPAWLQAAGDVFPGQQSYQNCGLQSARQLIEQAKGQCLAASELEFLEGAIQSCQAEQAKSHPADSGGSNASVRRCVLQKHDVNSTIESATISNVEDALKSGKGVIVSADVEVLWSTQGIEDQAGRHAVVLTHGDYDDDGKLMGVYVNDTGINKRYRLSREELEDCLVSGSGQMNVTTDSIWPTN